MLGSLNMDLSVAVPQIPRPGETVLGGPVTSRPGGKGANQAAAVARLGGDVHLIGRLGRDGGADTIRSALLDAGVSLTHVRSKDNVGSGMAFVTVDSHGENAIVVSSGANSELTAAEVESEADVLKESRIAVAQLETPLDAVTRFAELCELYEVDLVLNAAPYRPLPPELIRLCTYLVLNRDEAAALTGISVRDPRDGLRALAEAARLGAASVVITLGGDGCIALTQDTFIELKAFEVPVVDTTGAGDAFVGAFAAALSQDSQVEEALLFAAATGAATCAQYGAQNPITSEEARRLLRQQPQLPRRTPASDLLRTTPSTEG
ncbi:ribokinase [Blastococcus sp. SYSU D00669]